MSRILLIILGITTSLPLIAQNGQMSLFFDQPVPGNTAVLFSPGLVSDELSNRDMAISPAYDELLYTVQYRGGMFSTIMHAEKKNGKWEKPAVANFSGMYNDLEPAYSPDGKKLYFASNRPLPGTTTKDYNLWVVTKENGKWSMPVALPDPVNTVADEFYPSVTKTGTIYFTRMQKEKGEDIVYCKWNNNVFEAAVSLPDVINTSGDEFNAFVDPDEQYVIYTGYKRKDAFGTGDLYISKKNEQGEWTASVNLGKTINGAGLTYCPYVSSDKKYFFFSSSRNSIIKTPFEKPQTIDGLKKLINQPLNGWDNIYWIEAGTLF
jgi:Tol biopolymer transport system component